MISSKTKPVKSEKTNKTEKALAAEKEQFGKQQLQSISKTITTSETPLKEKYARNIIMGTHKEGGAMTFWSYVRNMPLASNAILSWKFCYVLHKMLRDGPRNVLTDSQRQSRNVSDMGKLWGSLHDRYGHIVALSAKFLCLKMDFHVKYTGIPPNLEASDEALEREAGTDINRVMDMSLELFDYMDAGLVLAETVMGQLDANTVSPSTPAGQCRLGPLIPVILDLSQLYHYNVKLLFKLHSRMAMDALLGHRERFREQFNRLRKFFDRAREMEFFKTVIQVPDLPEAPPNFLRASALADYVKPVGGMLNQEPSDDMDLELQTQSSYMFNKAPDEGFDQKNTQLDSLRKELEVVKPELEMIKTEAQRCVSQLKAQVNRLEAELEEQRTHKQMALVENERLRMDMEVLQSEALKASYGEADGRAQAAELRFCQLKERHAELVTSHAELQRKTADTAKLLSVTQQNQDDMARLKHQLANEVEHLRRENAVKLEEQRYEIDRLKGDLQEKEAELSFIHMALKDKETADDQLSSVLAGLQAEKEALLRSVRDLEAEVASLRQAVLLHQSSLHQERERSARELGALQSKLQQQTLQNEEQRLEIDRLKRDLEAKTREMSNLQSTMINKDTSSGQLSSVLVGLQTEKEVLLRSVRQQEAEVASLRQAAQLHQSSLEQERERSARELGVLQSKLQQQAGREEELQRKLQDEQFCLLQCAVVESEGIILDAVAKLDDPVHVRCTSTPDYLINRAEITLSAIDKMKQSHTVYLSNMDDASGLLRAVTQFSHLAADTIVNGGATAHTAPTDQSDRLMDNCRDCATHCLQFLKELKLQLTLERADPAAIRYVVQRILNIGQELRPKGSDVRQEELGEMVDREMAATSSAIEEAVLRMDEILSQARKESSGLKLEVNQSIIGSCSDLMRAVHMLVTAATALQKDIVEDGRGLATVKEFYAKNSRWTEGLISAAKTVGWGATQLLDSADRVVLNEGKYEELIAFSHEIAASTAQLVAASKVKADRGNKKLQTLQQASRHVNDMAANVVTSTKHGQQQIEEKEPMDFSGISLIKLKTEEMDSQVKVLELESQLEGERLRLGELRRKHYELAGLPLDQSGPGDRNGLFPPPDPLAKPEPPKPTISKKPSLFQKSTNRVKSAFR